MPGGARRAGRRGAGALAAEGEADAGGVEDAIFNAIESEFEQVSADPYKLPVKDADVPALYKGDKKVLSTLAKEGGADLLVAGTLYRRKRIDV